MKIAYFDCFSGISGDMTLGAFLDAGLDLDALSAELAKLKLKGYTLKKSRVMRGALAGTKFDCIAAGKRSHDHRSLKQILAIIDKSRLSERAKKIGRDIFTNIGQAEARVHGISPKSDVRLHELGDIDSIVDIVGTAIAVDSLDIGGFYASRITLGSSRVSTRHGTLPVPAPATLELLKDAPVNLSSTEAELVTPTGAGILKTLVKGFGAAPQMAVSSIGYGAGSRQADEMPNMLRVIIGEPVASFGEDRISVIETNIDDMNPQHFEYLFERLFKEGALDVYTTAIQMKKSRPAFLVTVLAGPKDLERLSSVIFKETTAIGVRYYEADRFKLERKFVKAKTAYGDIKVKVSASASGAMTVSPEYDECVRIARSRNIPLKKVYEEARRAVKI